MLDGDTQPSGVQSRINAAVASLRGPGAKGCGDFSARGGSPGVSSRELGSAWMRATRGVAQNGFVGTARWIECSALAVLKFSSVELML